MTECLYCGTKSITDAIADKSPEALLTLRPQLHVRQREAGSNSNPLKKSVKVKDQDAIAILAISYSSLRQNFVERIAGKNCCL